MNNARSPQGAHTELILRPAGGGEDIALTGELRIGREKDCEICIDDQRISRYHARLRVTPAGIILEDLHSTNGTYVNGRQIWGAHSVSLGDELRFHEQAYRLVSNKSQDRDLTLFVLPSAPPGPAAGVQDAGAVRPAPTVVASAAVASVQQRSPTRPPPPRAATAAPRAPAMPAASAAPARPQAVGGATIVSGQGLPAGAAAPKKSRDRPSAIERQGHRLRDKETPQLDKVAQLPRGSWLELLEEGGRRLTCCKLSSGAPTMQRFYFVSRSGFGQLEISSLVLSQRLEQGQVRVLERGPRLGRLLVRLSGALRAAEPAASGDD